MSMMELSFEDIFDVWESPRYVKFQKWLLTIAPNFSGKHL